MKPVRRFPTSLHVMAVAILASGFIGSMISLSSEDSVASLEQKNETLLAGVSVGDVGDVGDVQIELG